MYRWHLPCICPPSLPPLRAHFVAVVPFFFLLFLRLDCSPFSAVGLLFTLQPTGRCGGSEAEQRSRRGLSPLLRSRWHNHIAHPILYHPIITWSSSFTHHPTITLNTDILTSFFSVLYESYSYLLGIYLPVRRLPYSTLVISTQKQSLRANRCIHPHFRILIFFFWKERLMAIHPRPII